MYSVFVAQKGHEPQSVEEHPILADAKQAMREIRRMQSYTITNSLSNIQAQDLIHTIAIRHCTFKDGSGLYIQYMPNGD